MNNVVGVCLISKHRALLDDLSFAVDHVRRALATTGAPANGGGTGGPSAAATAPVLQALLAQTDRYLGGQHADFDLQLMHYETVEAARTGLKDAAKRSAGRLSLEMLLVNASELGGNQRHMRGFFDAFQSRLVDDAASAGVTTRFSPGSTVMFLERDDADLAPVHLGGKQLLRILDGDRDARRADLLRVLVDHLEVAKFNRLRARALDAQRPPVTLARSLIDFLDRQQDGRWDFFYYTGSLVSAFIDSMADQLRAAGRRPLTGPNEHALACGALAGWQLYRRGYLITITSGMVDEFKGTLSNMKRARARGFIICAETPANAWYPFQGTVNHEGDARKSIAAKNIPYVYIEKPADIAEKLAEAARLYEADKGPVFIFATQTVLESTSETLLSLPQPAPIPLCAPNPVMTEPALDAAMEIINHQKTQVLWQCGRLSDAARETAYRIAEKAGIVLADSLLHPGCVAPYRQGRRFPNYLGPLAMYGFTKRIYNFLHTDHRLNGKDAQVLFFLKGKVDQAATPFSEGKLARQLRIVQVNTDTEHLSPFTDLAINLPVSDFLRAVEARLDVDPAVLEHRRDKIAALNALSPTDPTDLIATAPMTPNYFFARLDTLLRDMIETDGYRFRGVFEVGRGGISSIRNVPRTDPGFSGWYGRALMGDALLATPYVALHAERNVLAFVGDGARALVPDIEHFLPALLAEDPRAREKNVTVFYLVNGMLSLIQSYLDVWYARHGGDQVTVAPKLNLEHYENIGALSVHRASLGAFDAEGLRAALLKPGRINLINVMLSHTSVGDGLSLISEKNWNRR